MGGRFLLLEDDDLVAKSLARLLAAHGETTHARLAREAAQLLRDSPRWSALFIDITLPDGNGLDVLALARDLGCTAPALVCTGWHDADLINRAFTLGARYVVKPPPFDAVSTFAERAVRTEGGARAWAARYGLTPAETDILSAAAHGGTREDIATQRQVHPTTLKRQVRNLLRKTGDPSLLAAASRVLREQLSPS